MGRTVATFALHADYEQALFCAIKPVITVLVDEYPQAHSRQPPEPGISYQGIATYSIQIDVERATNQFAKNV